MGFCHEEGEGLHCLSPALSLLINVTLNEVKGLGVVQRFSSAPPRFFVSLRMTGLLSLLLVT